MRHGVSRDGVRLPGFPPISNGLWPSGTGTRFLNGTDTGVRLLSELRLVRLQSDCPFCAANSMAESSALTRKMQVRPLRGTPFYRLLTQRQECLPYTQETTVRVRNGLPFQWAGSPTYTTVRYERADRG